MSAIIARLTGGIGNQLFTYCAARRLSIINNAELILDITSGFCRDYTYERQYQLNCFDIPCDTFSPRLYSIETLRRKFSLIRNKNKTFFKRNYIFQETIDFDSRLLNFRFNGKVYFEGYWQSELYFKDKEAIIRKDLSFKKSISVPDTVLEKIIKSNSVAIHFRFFDLPKKNIDGKGYNLLLKYYDSAIAVIKSKVTDPLFIIFSNDSERAKSLLKNKNISHIIIQQNPYENQDQIDLMMLSNCKHFIIANSTYSWWGAWLSSNKNKIVISPNLTQSGLLKWGFNGLLPKEWIKIDI